jgi:hypothetical protein
MTMKLITEKQVTALKIGDTIKRYPYNGGPEETFDESRPKYIEAYSVRSITSTNKMIELVMTEETQSAFAMPGYVNRIFVVSDLLVAEKTWWVDDGVQKK